MLKVLDKVKINTDVGYGYDGIPSEVTRGSIGVVADLSDLPDGGFPQVWCRPGPDLLGIPEQYLEIVE